jgi:hypothetical protein
MSGDGKSIALGFNFYFLLAPGFKVTLVRQPLCLLSHTSSSPDCKSKTIMLLAEGQQQFMQNNYRNNWERPEPAKARSQRVTMDYQANQVVALQPLLCPGAISARAAKGDLCSMWSLNPWLPSFLSE